jgi:hypothetical protein
MNSLILFGVQRVMINVRSNLAGLPCSFLRCDMTVSFIYSVLQMAWEHLALSRNVKIAKAICLPASSVAFRHKTFSTVVTLAFISTFF